jgi:hypothetical protein
MSSSRHRTRSRSPSLFRGPSPLRSRGRPLKYVLDENTSKFKTPRKVRTKRSIRRLGSGLHPLARGVESHEVAIKRLLIEAKGETKKRYWWEPAPGVDLKYHVAQTLRTNKDGNIVVDSLGRELLQLRIFRHYKSTNSKHGSLLFLVMAARNSSNQ